MRACCAKGVCRELCRSLVCCKVASTRDGTSASRPLGQGGTAHQQTSRNVAPLCCQAAAVFNMAHFWGQAVELVGGEAHLAKVASETGRLLKDSCAYYWALGGSPVL